MVGCTGQSTHTLLFDYEMLKLYFVHQFYLRQKTSCTEVERNTEHLAGHCLYAKSVATTYARTINSVVKASVDRDGA